MSDESEEDYDQAFFSELVKSLVLPLLVNMAPPRYPFERSEKHLKTKPRVKLFCKRQSLFFSRLAPYDGLAC